MSVVSRSSGKLQQNVEACNKGGCYPHTEVVFCVIADAPCTLQPVFLPTERSQAIEGVEAAPYKAAGQALEVIPRTLAQNCGANVIRTLTKLRAKHAETPVEQPCPYGINGETGEGQGLSCAHVCVQDSMYISW